MEWIYLGNIIRAKTLDLIKTRPLTELREKNSQINLQEIKDKKSILASMPRRIVFELTNSCNLNCIMCGRNSASFKPTFFDMKWFKKFSPIYNHVEEVTLMGWGEPTIHPHFGEMLEILNDAGVRIYFCTNGMKLDSLTNKIFEHKVDVMAVSLDGSDYETNAEIRRGSDLTQIVSSLKNIVKIKKQNNLKFPYINFVFTLMKRNIDLFPKMITLAAEVGIEEVKGVYLTAFDNNMISDILYDEAEKVKEIFKESEELAAKYNILLKLPHVRGTDPAGDKRHKDCYTAYRDFFLGSDGYVRACMSNSIKLFHVDKYDDFESAWNGSEFVKWREVVNTGKMAESCKYCYQSSYANWNKLHAFDQRGVNFSPDWD